MKKKLYWGIIPLAFFITVGYGMKNMENHIILGDLALENVEALAQGEGGGESGTSVGYCYLQGYGGRTSGYKVYCDRQTSNGKIYPCPSESMGSYSESARDRCTK